MVERLKLILKPIPWFLVGKALVFGLAWIFLPSWVFWIVALYLYFVPLFKPSELGWPFFVTMVFSVFLEKNLLMALFLASIFYLILGIKDLIFVRRKDAYETLVLLLIFLIFFNFFLKFNNWLGYGVVFGAVFSVVAVYFLIRGFIRYEPLLFSDSGQLVNKGCPGELAHIGLGVFLIFQTAWVLLILPMSYLYRTSVVFLMTALLIQLTANHLDGDLTKRQIVAYFSIFFAFLVFVLSSNSWEI